MPPESGIALSDVLTVVSIIVGVGLSLLGFGRWLMKQFDDRDDKIASATAERARVSQSLSTRIDTVREHTRGEIARVDKEVAALRERIATIPTRREIDNMLRERFAPVERDVRSLVIELARHGLDTEPRARREDSEP